MTRRPRLRLVSFALVVSVLFTCATQASALSNVVPERTWIRVTPSYGKFPKGLGVYLRPWEQRVTRHIDQDIGRTAVVMPATHQLVTWYLEPSVVGSPTLELSRRVLLAAQEVFEENGVLEGRETSVVVGRTQGFIDSRVKALGCYPDLRKTFGQYLMGASLCGHDVVTMNLTGYLFLDSWRAITPAEEQRVEPSVSAMSYLIADRNASALAHEWTHSVRTEVAGGAIPPGEPTWFSEGLAEFVSELARARAYGEDSSFQEIHSIEVRLFTDWPSSCTLDLRLYRIPITRESGCEYSLGNLALELLVAEFGGLGKVMSVYRRIDDETFEGAFASVYGMSLATFEGYANRYIRDVASIGFGADFRRLRR